MDALRGRTADGGYQSAGGKDAWRNVTYVFKGNVDNAALLEDYITENYYLFVNVSSSEGIPVSIMEASSVGIPCLATDVGGTGEIISDGVNGLLLRADVSDRELADRITWFCGLDGERYLRFRKRGETDLG